jgi:hypothetical protein
MPQFDQSIEYSGGIIDANDMEDEIKTKNKALKQKIIFSIILLLLSFNHNSVSGGFCPDGLLNLAVRISKQRPGGLDFFSGCRAMAAGRHMGRPLQWQKEPGQTGPGGRGFFSGFVQQ